MNMPDNQGRTTEQELAEAVVKFLRQHPKGAASYREIAREISNYITLTQADQMQSESRPAEELWEQRLRNITSHKNAEGNYIHEGRLKEIPGGLSLP